MALTPCLAQGCTELAERSYCPAHTATKRKQADLRRGPRPWYTGEWKAVRDSALRKTPWCVRCGGEKDLTVDHVIPRSLEGGVQVLCRKCNSAKGGRV